MFLHHYCSCWFMSLLGDFVKLLSAVGGARGHRRDITAARTCHVTIPEVNKLLN